ncbi:MAG: polyphosphate polymerase domain-containing protein [Lachnospiraceae bacterium]|nr:polyphosphate polymerase domain-containing protein [Lachnospiraceae bacterium]
MDEGKKPIFRHELKYRISEVEKDILIARIKDILPKDKNAVNGQYLIRSLYFDDYWKSAYEEKQSGVASRRKYRIRIYDYSDKVIKLECKHKQENYIYKESASLTRAETEQILNGEYRFLLDREESVCKEFYVACVSEQLRPEVIVDYERIPFVYDAGTVRITFDMNVRAGVGSTDLFDVTIPTLEALEQGELILEVKYTQCIPELIRSLLPPESAEKVAASKYCMCYDRKYDLMR